MKKILLIFIFSCITYFASAQLLCVQCFDQNDSIGVNVGNSNKIINGGFENTTCGFNSKWGTFCTKSPFYNCNIANWTCIGGGSASYPHFYDSDYQYVLEGTHSPYFGNLYGKVRSFFNEDSTCKDNSGCVITCVTAKKIYTEEAYGGKKGVSLSQTIKGMLIGSTYVLEFWAGGGYTTSSPFSIEGLFSVDIGFGNIFLKNKPTPPHDGTGTRYLISFKATTSTQTIKFTSYGPTCIDCSELILDNVRLYPASFLPPTIPICAPDKKAISENAVKVYLNPATNQIIITFEEEQKNTSIKITDDHSRLIIGMNVTGKQLTLDRGDMKKGAYSVQITVEKKKTIKRKIILD